MTEGELLEHARKQPFKPFRVVLTTGAKYDIYHPDLIMVGRRSATIGIVNDPNRISYDRAFFVDLLHVVGVEELLAQTPLSANGTPPNG